ncbi:heat shock protein 70 [Echinococcus multilocularis]|uniref:Heat shock protein 70 n=1 Tax=Echinococcus multilocularis TaxID=6211 RepID=A0A0S4MMP9_ECHMU|nr:heat shock protein 70 [Echinococcus multilocularis]
MLNQPKVALEFSTFANEFFVLSLGAFYLAIRPLRNGHKTMPNVVVGCITNVFRLDSTEAPSKSSRLNVLRLINAPTAAAIAHSLDKGFDGQCNILVFDLGGGILNVSILSIKNGKFEVLEVGGDTYPGGDDFDFLLMDYFVEEFKQAHVGKNLTNKKDISCLRMACEEAEKMLSLAEYTKIEVETLLENIVFSTNLTRAVFEQLCSDLFNWALHAVKMALSDAKMDKADIHEILLGKELKRYINADEAVVCGAAMLAANLTSDRSEGVQDLMLLEVTPLSIGVEVKDGVMSTVIERNVLIPRKQTHIISTADNNQTMVMLEVLKFESKSHIEVTSATDENGILNVSAVDKSSGNKNSIPITSYRGRLLEEKI